MPRRRRIADGGPVADDLLRRKTRPFDEHDRDAAVGAGADGVDHARIGQRLDIAGALQLELLVVHAARHVCRQGEKQVDALARPGRKRQRPDQQSRHRQDEFR